MIVMPFIQRETMAAAVRNRFACLRHWAVFFILSLALLMPAAADALTVVSQQDVGNVTVMEVTGDFDLLTQDGTANYLARADVAQAFYETHRDEYDFLVFFTNFDINMPLGVGGYFTRVRNDIQGINVPIEDYSAQYGSNQRLSGTIDLGSVVDLDLEPLSADFEQTMMVLTHEQMHRWGANVRFKEVDDSISTGLLGIDNAHWSYLLDSNSSTLYGNHWIDNGDGSFTSVKPTTSLDNGYGKLFSPLELYLMGIYDETQVPDMLLIKNPTIDPAQLPSVGDTITGEASYVSIRDIIAAEGPRVPAAADAPKTFRTAFIYLAVPGTVDQQHVAGIEALREEWIKRFSILTDGVGMMEVRVDLPVDDGVPSNPGVMPPSYTPHPDPVVNDGVAWLVNSQQTGGFWQDQAETVTRDTAAAVAALKNFPAANQSYQDGLTYLGSAQAENTDYLARFVEGLSDPTAAISELLAKQNLDGGWGSDSGYLSSPADTALALKALAKAGHNSTAVQNAVTYLKAAQNPDGGWSAGGGTSLVQPTSHVLAAFNTYRSSYALESEIASGVSWLVAKQNPDGGFGNSPSTVYDTAAALYSLRQLGADATAVSGGVSYLLSTQANTGGWNGSAFQTALAVDALWIGQVQTDLSISENDITVSPAIVDVFPADVTVTAKVWNRGATSVASTSVMVYAGDPDTGTLLEEQFVALPGESSVDVSVPYRAAQEGYQQFSVVVDSSGSVEEASNENNMASQQIYIGPPPPQVSFSKTSSSDLETVASGEVTITLEFPWHETITADVVVSPASTAEKDIDYVFDSVQVIFEPGEISKTISFNVVDDLVVESNETICFSLSNPVNTTIGQAEHLYTIIDEDAPPFATFGASGEQVWEDAGKIYIDVNIYPAWNREVYVDYIVEEGTTTGSNVEDYILHGSRLIFAPGETKKTIELDIVNDIVDESSEIVYLKLSDSNAFIPDNDNARYRVSVIDNDKLPYVNITSPSDQDLLGFDIDLEYERSNTGPNSVSFLLDGAAIEWDESTSLLNFPYSPCGVNIGSLSNGPHVIRVVVTNEAGQSAFDEVSFSVDTSMFPPQLVWEEKYIDGHPGTQLVVVNDYGEALVGFGDGTSIYDRAKNIEYFDATVNANDIAVNGEEIFFLGHNYDGSGYLKKKYRDGSVAWSKSLPYQQFGGRLSVDSNGNVYVVSGADVSVDGHEVYGGKDILITKYNSFGEKIWSKIVGGDFDDSCTDIKVVKNDEIYLYGSTSSYLGDEPGGINSGGTDLFIIKYDSDFVRKWAVQVGTDQDETSSSMTLDSEGAVYLSGTTSGAFDSVAPTYNTDAVVVKVSSEGVLEWVHQNHEINRNVHIVSDDRDIVCLVGSYGLVRDGLYNSQTIKLAKYNQEGNFFTNSIDWTGLDLYVRSVDLDKDGGLFIRAFSIFINHSTSKIESHHLLRRYSFGGANMEPALSLDPVYGEVGSDKVLLEGYVQRGADVSIQVDSNAVVGPVKFSAPTRWLSELSLLSVGNNQISVSANDGLGNTKVVVQSYDRKSPIFENLPYESIGGSQVGTNSTDLPRAAVKDDAGNVYVVGETYGTFPGTTNRGLYDVFLQRFDSQGNPLPAWQTGTEHNEYGGGVAVDASGNVYIAWRVKYVGLRASDTNYSDMVVAKYSPDGVQEWIETVGSKSDDYVAGIAVDADSNVYLAGYSYGSVDRKPYGGNGDYVLVKFNANGAEQWTVESGEVGGDFVYGMTADSAGNVFLVGEAHTGLAGLTAESSPFVVKYNSAGVRLWTKLVDNQHPGRGLDVSVGADGSVYVAGIVDLLAGGRLDAFLMKYGSNGAPLWLQPQIVGMKSSDSAEGVACDSEGNVYIAGKTDGSIDGIAKIGLDEGFVSKFGQDGTKKWSKIIGTDQADYLVDVVPLEGGGCTVVGYTTGDIFNANFGSNDVFVMQLTPRTAPNISLNSVQSPTNLLVQTLSGTMDSGATISISADTPVTVGAVTYPTSTTWNCQISGLSLGMNNITVTATDQWGSSDSIVGSIFVDQTPPTLDIDPVETPTNQDSQVVSGNREDGAVVEVSVNGQLSSNPVEYPTVTTWQNTVDGFLEGDNDISVTAVDGVGNINSVSTVINYVYVPPPTLSVTPNTVSADYQGTVALAVGGLYTPGSTVIIEQVVDANQNGVIDDGEVAIRRFAVTDGTTSSNPNIPGDEDGLVDGAITTNLNYFHPLSWDHAVGNTLFRVTGETGSSAVSFELEPVLQTQTIGGLVSDGVLPLPGALVTLADQWGRPLGHTFADSTGLYVLHVAEAGDYQVRALAKDHVFDLATASAVALGAGQNVTDHDLLLIPGTYHLQGQILDSTGSFGLAGVWVEAVSSTYLGGMLTDALGAYDLLVPAGDYDLWVRDDVGPNPGKQGHLGYGRALQTVSVAADTSGIDITLSASDALVCGTVADSSAQPVPGVLVQGLVPEATNAQQPMATAVTDGSGQYCLGLNQVDSWDISLADDAAQAMNLFGTRINGFTTGTHGLTGNDLTASSVTAWVEGQVNDDTATALANVAVWVGDAGGTSKAQGRTAADGSYRLGAVPGDWLVGAHPEALGYGTVDDQGVTLLGAQTATVDFVAGPTLANTIVVTKASYTSRKTTLLIEATSDYGADAALEVEGFGPMTWDGKSSKWIYEDLSVSTPPATVTVLGPEGSQTMPVTVK